MLVGDVFPAVVLSCVGRIVTEQSFFGSNAEIDVTEIGDAVSSASNRLSSGGRRFPVKSDSAHQASAACSRSGLF